MGVWKRDPQVDASTIAAIQAQIDADPMVQRFRAGYGSEGDPWTREKGGKVKDAQQLAKYIEERYDLPKGYNVSTDGQVVYGNETGWLRKVVTAAAPIAGPMLIGAAFPSTIGVTAGAGGATTATAGATVAPTVAATTTAGAGAATVGLSARDFLDLAIFGGKTAVDLYAGKKAGDAAADASDKTAKAAADALALLREQWEQDQANFAPFLAMGTTAANKINAGLQSATAPNRPANVARVIGPGSAQAPTMSSFVPGARGGATMDPRGDVLTSGRGQFTLPGERSGGMGTFAQPVSPVPEKVRMQDPTTGEIRLVPQAAVPKYTARGAVMV